MKILRNKKILILSITAVALLTLTLGVSYAYFTATVTGNDSAVVTKIVAGILDVDFTITDRISNDNIILIKDEKREEKAETLDFTVSNNGRGTLDAVYYIYLTDVNITNNLKSPDFKWELIKNDDTVFTGDFSSAETNTDFTITSETNNGIVIPVKQELSVGQVDRYKLRIWLSETDADQNNLLNGSFSGKVRVTSTQLTGSEKYVVFKDQSGTQLGKKIISDGKTNYTMDISGVNLTGSTNIYCNNGGIPTLSNNTLSIDGVTNNTECKLSNDIMDTIANQLTTSKTGIVMTNDQSGTTTMTIPAKEVVLDLNGKSITGVAIDTTSADINSSHHGFILNGTTFTVNDSVGTGSLSVGKDGRTLYASDDSTVVINGGTFLGRQAVSTRNRANVTINGGTFNSKLYETIYVSYSTDTNITINDGTFNNVNGSAVISNESTSTNSTITINGGTFTGKDRNVWVNTTNGTVNINGGTFECSNCNIVASKGTVNISGGRLIGAPVVKTTISNTGTLNISGGHITATNSNAISNSGGTLNINANPAVFNNSEYVSGLYVEAYDKTPALISSGNATINGGTFNQVCPDVSKCNSSIYHYQNQMKIYDAVVNNDSNMAIWSISGDLYIYDGTFNGAYGEGTYNGYSGSQNYICGGTFNNSGVDIKANDSAAMTKYKSSVVWTGKTSPTITGSYPSTVSLDDTIVCPSN